MKTTDLLLSATKDIGAAYNEPPLDWASRTISIWKNTPRFCRWYRDLETTPRSLDNLSYTSYMLRGAYALIPMRTPI